MKDKTKRPAFQFYPKEWIWDIELRQCSPAARGLWIDLMCIMHEGEPYGHLTAPLDLILRMTGLDEKLFKQLLAELETERASGKRVAYRTDKGVIYSRRMVRDEERRSVPAENGTHGGRPRKNQPAEKATFPEATPNAEPGFDAESAFNELWEAYPAKGRVQRIEAQHAFVEKIRSRESFNVVLAAVTGKFAKSEKWAKGFIMALPRWIVQESWNESPEPDGKPAADAPQYTPYKPPQ